MSHQESEKMSHILGKQFAKHFRKDASRIHKKKSTTVQYYKDNLLFKNLAEDLSQFAG